MLAQLLMMSTLISGGDTPQELGEVNWERDLDAGLARSESSGKPLFLLFQEIPGCATCRNFGDGPLSDPLLVDVIENEFHPVAVYNNLGGEDAASLKRFREPSWNNPVVRFVDSEGQDLIPRRDGVYNRDALLTRAAQSLEAAKREVPDYLALATATTDGTSTVVFAMHCYWQGEARLGALDGVVSTRCGWYDGNEVVEVQYRPQAITLPKLVGKAREMECASAVYLEDPSELAKGAELGKLVAKRLAGEVRDAKQSDQRYYLSHSTLRFVPMSEAQSVRVNAALGAREDATRYLSPTQRRVATRLKKLADETPEVAKKWIAHPPLTELRAVVRSLK